MKSLLTLLVLLVAQSASANKIAIQLVPCTDSESVCAKVYQDFTTRINHKGREMAIVSDGHMRAQLYGAFSQAKGELPVIGVEGQIFPIFDGREFRLKIVRFLSATGN